MVVRWRAFLSAVILICGGQAVTAAADKPLIPFESYFAGKRTNGEALQFNDFSGKIPGDRIKALLRSGNVLGDRVLLQNGIAVYFPEGYIVSASMTLDEYQPKSGMNIDTVRSSSDLEPNPNYHLVGQFEHLLGPVCAETSGAVPGTKIRARQKPNGVLSVIQIGPGQFDSFSGETSVGYQIVSAIEAPFLGGDAIVVDLVERCLAP